MAYMTKCHFITPVWGEKYIDTFLRLSLPTQLSPGNLGWLGGRPGISYNIYTRPCDVEKFSGSKAISMLRKLMNVSIVPATNINFSADHHYKPFSGCYKLGMKQASRYRAACVFLTADQIWADGSFESIIGLGDAGKRAVMISGPRVMEESFVPAFLASVPKYERPEIVLPPREAVRLAIQYMHPWDRSLFWEDGNIGRPASFMFWGVGDEGFLMRCFHLHPILVNPKHSYSDFYPTIDGSDFVKRCCPNIDQVHVVKDSDQVMYFSIAPAKQSAELINRPKRNWRGVISWSRVMGLSLQNIYYLQNTIRFHVGEMSDQWIAVERQSDVLVGRLIKDLDNAIKLAFYGLFSSVRRQVVSYLERFPWFYRFIKRHKQILRRTI